MERKNAWSQYSAEELSRLEAVNEDYKACLDAGKTERECVRLTIERIEKEGYKNLKEVIEFFNDKQELLHYLLEGLEQECVAPCLPQDPDRSPR